MTRVHTRLTLRHQPCGGEHQGAGLGERRRVFAEVASIETAMRKSEAARTALRIEGVRAVRTAKAILTPAQRDKWRATLRERHRAGRHGHGYGEDSGPREMSRRDG